MTVLLLNISKTRAASLAWMMVFPGPRPSKMSVAADLSTCSSPNVSE